ncbi:MAG: sulfurtransferase [Tahibacter sp.]
MILNIAAYQFAPVDDPEALAAILRERARSALLRGTILIAGEGLNLFLAGEDAPLEGFLDRLREDPRFAGIVVKRSHSADQPFARLKVKCKKEIISFRQPRISPLAERAPAVTPARLAAWLQAGRDDNGRRVVLLDTRNRDEVRHGTFDGAICLPIDRFTDLPAALEAKCDELADATVVSFCTGGIRCEKAALWMRGNGLPHTVQLEGGILGYFEQMGGYAYRGACFVFDERVALDPSLAPRGTVDPSAVAPHVESDRT